jgi:hypothetical protein
VSRYRIVAGVVTVVVGVVAIVLADDVRSWRDTLRDDAVAYSVAPGQKQRLTAPTALPAGVAGQLLRVERDREWLEALRVFTRADEATRNVASFDRAEYALLNAGRAVLGRMTQDPDPARASQAYDLLAVLVYRESSSSGVVDQGLVREAVTDLQNAVRLDGTNEDAEANLELLLRIVTAPRQEQQQRAIGRRETKNRKGGYGGTQGTGY